MTFGISLKGINTVLFNHNMTFYFEILPLLVFAVSLFGYMVTLIFIKWIIDWDNRMLIATYTNTGFVYNSDREWSFNSTTAFMYPLDYGGSGDGCQSPNLITMIVDMFLSPGSVEEPMFSGQDTLQILLLLSLLHLYPSLR